MGRLPRPTGDDLIYHAINRGNNRADVLGPDGERDMFLGDLARTKARHPFALFGYCLMSNHFHLLLKPAPGQSISRILQSLTVAHTWRHHRRQGTSGHVWQGRFRSPVVQDGDHLLVVLRYIEANPVRAAMVADPCEYTWSSHRCHGAGHADPILDSFPEWEQLGRTEPERRARWRRKVRGEQPAKELDGVRSSVRSGRPYGAEDWVEVISHRLGIVREPRRRGRPPREKMLRHRNSLDTGIPSEPTVEILYQGTGWDRLFSQFGDGFTDIVEPTTQLSAQDSFLVPAQGIAVVAGEHLRHPRQQLGRALEFSPKQAQVLIELLRKSQELSLPRTMVRGRNIA